MVDINIYYCNQIGFMITWGTNYERRKYICIDIPFCTIQVFLTSKEK